MTTYDQKKELLTKKEQELEQLKDKIAKGQVFGNGAPQMLQDLVTEIHQLKIDLHRSITQNVNEKEGE